MATLWTIPQNCPNSEFLNYRILFSDHNFQSFCILETYVKALFTRLSSLNLNLNNVWSQCRLSSRKKKWMIQSQENQPSNRKYRVNSVFCVLIFFPLNLLLIRKRKRESMDPWEIMRRWPEYPLTKNRWIFYDLLKGHVFVITKQKEWYKVE